MIKPAEANSTAPRRRCCGGRVILEDIDVSTVDVFPLALFNKWARREAEMCLMVVVC